MATLIASSFQLVGALGAPKRVAGPLIAVDCGTGELVATYPMGTPLDTAVASAAYHDSGSREDMIGLLRLQARDGDEEAVSFFRRYPAA